MNNQSNLLNYTCLYTTQKTQKRKRWSDGKLVLNLNNHQALLYAIPVTGAAPLDTLEMSAWQTNAMKSRKLDELEFEKYLVQIDGVWDKVKDEGLDLTRAGVGNTSASSSMQKLLSKKFVRPAPFVPRLNSSSNTNFEVSKRRRPLQPGELLRQHYGEDVVAKQEQQYMTQFLDEPSPNQYYRSNGGNASNHSQLHSKPVYHNSGPNTYLSSGAQKVQYRDPVSSPPPPPTNQHQMQDSKMIKFQSVGYSASRRVRDKNFRTGEYNANGKKFEDDLEDASDYNASEFYGEQKLSEDESSYNESENISDIVNIPEQSYESIQQPPNEGSSINDTIRQLQVECSHDRFRANSDHVGSKITNKSKSIDVNKTNERVSKADLLQLFGADSDEKDEPQDPIADTTTEASDDDLEKRLTESEDRPDTNENKPIGSQILTNFWSGAFDDEDGPDFENNVETDDRGSSLDRDDVSAPKQFSLTLPSPCSSSDEDDNET